VEEEDEFVDGDSLVDWDFPSIYDIYPNEENLLKEVNFWVDTLKIIEENDVHQSPCIW
jgi:hypothetical protein